MSTGKDTVFWEQIIPGEPASKSNSRRLVSIKGKPRVIKSEKALKYSKQFESYVRPPDCPITGDVKLIVEIWYKTRRPDLDPSLIMDLLQKTQVIENDRQIKEIHAFHHLDKENPRAKITISSLNQD
jgi:Holliday junction resolvase RusA-like endonuclease